MEREYAIHRAGADRLLRHAEYHGRLLGFGDHETASLLHCAHALAAVVAHAREDDGHQTATEMLRRRMEQAVDGRRVLLARLRRRHARDHARAQRLELEVTAARR